MLVLSRKEGQEIVLGDDVVVRVIRTQGNRVQIGIQAPSNVKIARGELPRAQGQPEAGVSPVTFPRVTQAG
jgi:carbon storage regulator